MEVVAPAVAPVAPIKKTVKKIAAKKTQGGKYFEMITQAITKLAERGGSSRQAILKYICANFPIEPKQAAIHLKMALKQGVKSGGLKQSKGVGASGSFKLIKIKEEKKKVKKPKVLKPKVKKVKKIVKKTGVKKAIKKVTGEKKIVKKVVKKVVEAIKTDAPVPVKVEKVKKAKLIKEKKPKTVKPKTVKPKKTTTKKEKKPKTAKPKKVKAVKAPKVVKPAPTA